MDHSLCFFLLGALCVLAALSLCILIQKRQPRADSDAAAEGDEAGGISGDGGAVVVAVEFLDAEAVAFEEELQFAGGEPGEVEGDLLAVFGAGLIEP